jgi:hypothetical protein
MLNNFVILLLLLIFIINDTITGINSSINGNDIFILLTTAVIPRAYNNTDKVNHAINNVNTRLEVYKNTINEWLSKTNLIIHIVDSTGYKFEEFSNNPRIKICSFTNNNDWGGGPTPYEAYAILHAYNYFELWNYDKIIKITGKYFIPNMEKIISNIPLDADIIFQYSHTNTYQQSEIFGCKTKYLIDIMNMILKNSKNKTHFEESLHTLNKNKNYKIYRLPKIIIKPTERSDGSYISKL